MTRGEYSGAAMPINHQQRKQGFLEKEICRHQLILHLSSSSARWSGLQQICVGVMLGKDISKNTFEDALKTTPYLVLHSVKEVARCCSTQDNRPYHGARHSPEKIFNLLIKCQMCHLRTPPKAPVMPPLPSEAASESERAVSSKPSLTRAIAPSIPSLRSAGVPRARRTALLPAFLLQPLRGGKLLEQYEI